MSCAEQLNLGGACVNYLSYKDCDKECGLCPCSTAAGTTKEHCSGHGICEASCTKTSCSDAKCKCETGWTGSKCESLGNWECYILYGPP